VPASRRAQDDNCIGVVAWMHTFSPAKAWIAGLDLLRKPLLHLHTQVNVSLPWDTIDMDLYDLNQAATATAEFGYIETRMALRRKTVVGHAERPGGPPAASALGASRDRLASGPSAPHGPLRATTCATWP